MKPALTQPSVILERSLLCSMLVLGATTSVFALDPPIEYDLIPLGTLPGYPNSSGVHVDASGRILGGSWTDGGVNMGWQWSDANGNGAIDPGERIALGSLGGGNGSLAAWANDFGVAVGADLADNAANKMDTAFRWSAESGIVALPALPGGWSSAFGINNAGIVVGRSRTLPLGNPASRMHAVMWPPEGGVVDITPVSSTQHTSALRINENGWILGRTQPSSSWVITPSGVKFFNGSTQIFASDLDDSGRVVGYLRLGNAWVATTWVLIGSTYQPTSLGHPDGFTDSFARATNESGDVVGSASMGGSGARAVIWPQSGGALDLNDFLTGAEGWILREASHISDAGIIVGYGDHNGVPFQAFALRPRATDSDGDGLLDVWESEGGGIDLDGDGTVDVDLHAMGANPMRKDLFVEVDAMTGSAPPPDLFDPIVEAFANAPVSNPDGSTGITLHVIVDETTLPLFPVLDTSGAGLPQDYFNLKGVHFGTPRERAAENARTILQAKSLAVRYCLFAAESADGTLGMAHDIWTDDFIVFRQHFVAGPAGLCETCDIDTWLASTFMHELGHALGLRHGGNENRNLKPNYVSTMNYLRQLPFRLDETLWKLDFSRGSMLPLDESNLDESIGLADATGANAGTQTYFTLVACDADEGGGSDAHSCAVTRADAARISVSGSVISLRGGPNDFNGDGRIESSVCADLNYYGANTTLVAGGDAPSPCQTHSDHDDWSALIYRTVAAATRDGQAFGKGGPPERIEELTTAMVAELMERLPGAASKPCPADFTRDGVVNGGDLAILLGAWGSPGADLTGDGTTDAADLSIVLGAWGSCG